MAEIGAQMKREVANPETSFSSMESLVLNNLSNLSYFCWENCTVEWSRLKKLRVENCTKILIFALGDMLQKDGICSTTPHLFTNKVVFPRLEELYLTHLDNLMTIWQGLPPSSSFIKLRVLDLDGCSKLLTAVPLHMIERLHNLRSMDAKNCDLLREIFNLVGPVTEEHADLLPRLTKLTLTNLPELVHIWKNPSQLAVCKNLRDLAVSNCKSLRRLFTPAMVPSLLKLQTLSICECEALEEIIPIKGQVNFQNLEVLQVINCNSLKSLCSIFTARCFEQLQVLKFYGCQKIKEILVENERDEGTGDDGGDEGTSGGKGGASDGIMFPKLKCIILKKLPSLASFCSGSSVFKWPSLETVRVKDCPSMKTFAQERQETPELKAVEVNFIHKISVGDLNTNIEHLFQRKNCPAIP